MLANPNRTRVLLSFAVVALMALLPGPVVAGGGTSDGGMPGVSLLVRMFTGTKQATSPAPHGDVDVLEAAPAPSPPAPTKAADLVEVPKVQEEAFDPGNLVREWHVMHVGGNTTEREGPLTPSDADCPKPATCKSHIIRPARFKTDKAGAVKIPWKFNDEGRRNLRAPAGLLESAVRSGMAEWSRWNSNVSFAYKGTTDATFGASGKDGSCADGTNTVTWHRFDPSVIAAVVTCFDSSGNTIRDADLALNVTQHWEDMGAEPDSRHSFDIRSIVTHELGHWLSLLDLYDGDSLGQTMMGNSEYGETRKRTLALGDIIGLQTAYPCGKGDTCSRKGIVDD